MNPILLTGYYHLLRYCESNKLYEEDCVIFVEENSEGLQVVPMSITSDDATGIYYTEMQSVFGRDPLKNIVHVQRMYNGLSREWTRQLETNDLEEGLHVLKYVDGNLSMLTREITVSFADI
jgi:hypothetical protein